MAYTSITTAGWASNGGVQAAYDKAFKWALKSRLVCYPLIDVQPQDETSRGSSVTMYKNAYFTEADVSAAATPLTEEADVTPKALPAPTNIVLTPAEYGLAVVRTQKLNLRNLTQVDPVIAQAVARHSAQTIDWLVQTKMRAATNIIRAAGRASTATIAAGDLQKATDIRKAVTTLRGGNVDTRDGQFFVGVMHPYVIHDLREESGAGSWRTPNEYGVSQDRIWNGEFGEFEGVRFVQTTSTFRSTDNDGATARNVFRGFILGAEALAKKELLEPTAVVSPVTDLLKRFMGVGWKADVDYGIYRQESIVALQAASSIA